VLDTEHQQHLLSLACLDLYYHKQGKPSKQAQDYHDQKLLPSSLPQGVCELQPGRQKQHLLQPSQRTQNPAAATATAAAAAPAPSWQHYLLPHLHSTNGGSGCSSCPTPQHFSLLP